MRLRVCLATSTRKVVPNFDKIQTAAQRCPQGPSRAAPGIPRTPKGAEKRPNGTPREPKDTPRAPKGSPRAPKGCPRAPKRGPAAPQGSPRAPQGRPKGAQGLPTLGFTPLLKSTFFSRWGSRKKMVARDRHQNDRTDVPRLFRQVQKIWNFTKFHKFCANLLFHSATRLSPYHYGFTQQLGFHPTTRVSPNY